MTFTSAVPPGEPARSTLPPEESAPSTSPPEKSAPSTLPPDEATQKSALARRRRIINIVLGLVAVIAVLLLIAFVVHIYNKEKVGKSDNPTAQKAALTLLETIPVKGWAPKTGYSRYQFGPPWTDDVNVQFGHNGCDTRNDILRRDLSDVTVRNCVVLSGVLHDPYTGNDIQFNRDEGTDVLVQVDHVVPLLDAWQTGAQQWDQAKRTQFANDPLDLLAVSGKANRKKKADDVAKWLPSNKDFRCDYVTTVVNVKAKYGLWMTQPEHDEASRVLTKCSSQTLPQSGVLPSSGVVSSPGVVPSSGVLPSAGTLFPSSSASTSFTTPIAAPPASPPESPAESKAQSFPPPPAPSPSRGSSVYYPDCRAARAAGAAPIYIGQPGYRPGLDRNGDGVACE